MWQVASGMWRVNEQSGERILNSIDRTIREFSSCFRQVDEPGHLGAACHSPHATRHWFLHATCHMPLAASVYLPLATLLAAIALTVACRLDMHVQPRYNPMDGSSFFDDGRSARPVIPGTVARGQLRTGDGFYTGMVDGKELDAFPFPVTRDVLRRGQERFNIYCTPCHDRLGTGHGMIVQRGFPQPPSYHIDRLRQAPVGHFVNVIANGYGTMYSYASRVEPRDRWAIAAYIRALQFSQNVSVSDLNQDDRQKLQNVQGESPPQQERQ